MLPTTTPPTTQTTTLADSDYARKRREVYKLLKILTELGASRQIRIPQIAVIGNQSAGKSSLVEAITGISVPRDSNTCTRCPMRCMVSAEATEWSCTISLQMGSDGTGTGSAPHATQAFSPRLTSKADVELWVRRAQTALLSRNHDVLPSSFASKTAEELKALMTPDSDDFRQFSDGVVLIDICDPEGTELAFIDLPGLIQNERDDIIALVKNLVEDNIKDQETVILLTLPASDDMKTVQAFKLAQEADPYGKRTIGVVTKPDTLTSGLTGLQKDWLEILQGRSHKLKLGYYVVRLPDDEQRKRNITRLQLDAEAQDFFASRPPWKNVSASRLGIPSLVSDLSALLMRIIQDSIPQIKQDATARLLEVNLAISRLQGIRTLDPVTEVVGRISSFCKDLRADVYGHNAGKRTFVHDSQDAHRRFKIAILKTMPDLCPFPQLEGYKVPQGPQAVDSDYMDVDGNILIQLNGPPLKVMDVRRIIKERTGWELPGHIPHEAREYLIDLTLEDWLIPALSCYNEVCAILQRSIDNNIDKHFSQFKDLERHMKTIITAGVERDKRGVLKAIRDVVGREVFPYYTSNSHYYESEYSKWLGHYRHANAYPHLGIPSTYESELVVMASVRAYCQVAYKRIIDHVPRTIQRDLNQMFVDGLEERLLIELKIGESDASTRLEELLKEDPQQAADHRRMLKEKRQLEEVISALNRFVI